jgi:hypothetical protein
MKHKVLQFLVLHECTVILYKYFSEYSLSPLSSTEYPLCPNQPLLISTGYTSYGSRSYLIYFFNEYVTERGKGIDSLNTFVIDIIQ